MDIIEFPADYAYIETGFATVRDVWDGLAMAYLDDVGEALAYLADCSDGD